MSQDTIKNPIIIVSGKNGRGRFYEAKMSHQCNILVQENAPPVPGHAWRRWDLMILDPTRPYIDWRNPEWLGGARTRVGALAALRAELNKRYPGHSIGPIRRCKCSKCRSPKA